MRPLAALGLVSLLAGCATVPGTPAPGPDALAGDALAFLPALAMAQPTSGAEPNLAVAADGTLFITAVAGSQERPNAAEGAAWLWRSKDAGATWETLREPQRDTPLGSLPMTRRPFGSSDADVVASADGWVYYSDWWNWGIPVTGTPVPRAGNYLVERSSDGGDTWEGATLTIPDPTDVDRQWLLAGEGGEVGLFWSYFHTVESAPARAGVGEGAQSLKAVFSRDHGATWETDAAVTVVPPQDGHGYQIAHPTALPDGTMVMPYGDVASPDDGSDTFWTDPSEVRVAVSDDGGATWSSRLVAAVPGGFDNLWAVQGAADDAGALHVAWAARTNETMTLFYATSADAGLTWSVPEPIRAEGLNFLPWVAARGAGQVAVGWYGSGDADATGDPVEAAADAAWFAYAAERASDGAAWTVTRVSDDPVKTGPVCPRGAACTADRELLDYVSLDYDLDGRLHFAFARSREVGGAKAGLVHYAGEAAGVDTSVTADAGR